MSMPWWRTSQRPTRLGVAGAEAAEEQPRQHFRRDPSSNPGLRSSGLVAADAVVAGAVPRHIRPVSMPPQNGTR